MTSMQALEFRSDLVQLSTLLGTQFATLFRTAGTDPAGSLELFHDTLPPLLDRFGLAAASLAADWYDDERERVAPKGRRHVAEPQDLRDTGVHALIGWSASQATDDKSLEALMLGGLQRRMLDYARDTVADNSIVDPGAQGWQRVASGGCDFCKVLASRGAVYTRRSVRFASHDNCNCSTAPAFKGASRPVDPYTPSLRNSTEADRQRVRDWIKANPGELE